MKVAWVYFKDNLRITDNLLLDNALGYSDQVFAFYYFDPTFWQETYFGYRKTAIYRAKFILEALEDLQYSLKCKGVQLCFIPITHSHTQALSFFKDLASQLLSDANTHINLYISNPYLRDESRFQKALIQQCIDINIGVNQYKDSFLVDPDCLSIKTKKALAKGFTPFRKQIEPFLEDNLPELSSTTEQFTQIRARELNEVEYSLVSLGHNKVASYLASFRVLPTLSDLGYNQDNIITYPHSAFTFKGGETTGIQRLCYYLWETHKITTYKKTRNGLLGLDYSSKLSAWLACGSLSMLTIYREILRFEDEVKSNESTYWLRFELLWRSYFKQCSYLYPDAIFRPTGIKGALFPQRFEDYQIKSVPTSFLKKWHNADTDCDFVNANLKELYATGWMSNRGRQNVASYWSKVLGLDWRVTAAQFESLLIDYDAASNYGNWCYVAGVGSDPRDRVFNTQLQADRYDNDRSFRKTWLV